MYQHNVGVGRTDFKREQINSKVAKALGIDSQREGITLQCGASSPVDSEEYNNSKKYIPRENRKKWSAVGLIGQLRVKQDGTLSAGDKCTCNDQGIATKTTKTTKAWYVMKVINPEIVQILFKQFF